MSRCQRVALLLCALPLAAAILPDGIEEHARGAVTALKPAPAAVWSEYGLQEAERAEYAGAKGKFAVSVWRLPDATSAVAAMQWLRPSVPTGATLQQMGNYVFQFEGFTPQEETWNQLRLHVPRLDNSALPSLTGFLPSAGRKAASERYILGPASLESILPGFSPSAVGFHFGTEGQWAKFQDRDGEVGLLLLSYPNHQIARDRLAALSSLPGHVVKRSGPLVGVVPKPPTADAAERILAQLRWETNVTLNQPNPDPNRDNIGQVILNVFIFVGVLIFFALVSGAGFAGFRAIGRKISGETDSGQGSVIALHIDDSAGK